MPVVTMGPRALAAPAGRSPDKGPSALPSAGEILFGSASGSSHTLSMFSSEVSTLRYVSAGVRGLT